jgi:uncharacterized membrane protein
VVVGESSFPPDDFGFLTSAAFRWSAGGGFASLGSQTLSANAVTADGSVIVGRGRNQAFRWTEATGAVNLGVLPGYTHSTATGVSDDGSVVVGLSHDFFLDRDGPGGEYRHNAPANRAFYWSQETGMQDLTQLLLDAGADLDGATINAAYGISPDGTWIHGITTVPDEEFPELFYDEVPLMMSLSSSPTGNLPGDYNASGQVEQADLDLVLLNWGQSGVPAGWMNSLPDGAIDQAELDGVLLNWGNAAGRTAASAVPEPSTIGILLVTGCLIWWMARPRTGINSF